MKLKFLLFIILIFQTLSFTSFNNLYLKNLNTTNYLKLKENLKVASFSLNKKNNWWFPYLTLNTGFGGISFNKDGLKKLPFSIKANFLEIYGSSIGISLPFSIDPNNNWIFNTDFKNLSLNLTRSLKKEPEVERLNAKSNYYNSLYNLKEYKDSVFINTVKSVFSKYYLTKVLELNKMELLIQKKKYGDILDKEQKKALKVQILQRQKIINSYLQQISLLPSEDIYLETKTLVKKLLKTTEKSTLTERLDLKAIELATKAKQLQKNNWFLPYLPDISLNFSISNFEKPTWNIGISFEYSIFDRGEKLISLTSRKINSSMYSYNETLKTIKNTITTLQNSQKNIETDIDISKITLSDLISDYKNKIQLYRKGFISNDDLILSNIKVELKKLEIEKYENDLLINKLNILKEFNFIEVIKVEKVN